jgi:hypothetical protein
MSIKAIVATTLLTLSACSMEQDRAIDPPPNVPINAVATGGLDGLHWTVCEKLSVTDFVCDIYRRGDGLKMQRGWYRLCLSQSSFRAQNNGGTGDGLGFGLHVTAISFRLSIYFNGFDSSHIAEKWTPADTGLDQDCLDIYPSERLSK